MALITGLPPGRSPARGGGRLDAHVQAEDRAALRQALGAARAGGHRAEATFRMTRPDDGREVWLTLSAIGAPGGPGAAGRVVGVVRDVSAAHGEATQQQALVAELDHRVKNVLASVQSLAAQSARRTVSLEAFLKTFFGRLDAMAAAHTLLTSMRWRGVDISHIAAAELGGLAQGQARWEGPELILNARATHALTLALHELAANAIRHGALSADAGRVSIIWRSLPDGGFELVWTERGGPAVPAPGKPGFGWTLLERVTAKELGGAVTIDCRPEGLRVVLTADARALATRPTSTLARSTTDKARGRPGETTPGSSRGGVAETDLAGVRVLIVEDAVLLALELESGLTECGAVVVGSAADIDEAIRMLALDFEVAVLDANLNGHSVAPVAQALFARGTPFIFATGYGADAPEGFGAPVVRKPYNIRQIAAALGVALTADPSVRNA